MSSRPADAAAPGDSLERSLGLAVRELRQRHNLTIAEVSARVGISSGMWSKIENGQTAMSLDTLARIGRALGVSLSTLFRRYDVALGDAQLVKAGEGMEVVRRGTKRGHTYHLLAYDQGPSKIFEPFLISLDDASEVFPSFEHPGTEFIHMLQGKNRVPPRPADLRAGARRFADLSRRRAARPGAADRDADPLSLDHRLRRRSAAGLIKIRVRPFMHTLSWLIVLLVNFGVIAAFAPSMADGDLVGTSVSALFAAISALLVAARFRHLPTWGHTAMKLLCWAIPVLALAGSLDYGIVSGQEILSLIVAALIGWGSWRAFLLFAPKANSAVNTGAAR